VKKEEIRGLIREHIALRKSIEGLQKQLNGLRDRYDEVGDLLYGYRSKRFIQSVLHCLVEMEKEYGQDVCYDDFLSSIIDTLQNFKAYDADRRNYTPKDLLHLYDEEVE